MKIKFLGSGSAFTLAEENYQSNILISTNIDKEIKYFLYDAGSIIAEYPNSIHAQFHQLCTLDDNIKNKMWLYHYSLNGKTYEELESEVLKNGFAGLIKKGQEFDI